MAKYVLVYETSSEDWHLYGPVEGEGPNARELGFPVGGARLSLCLWGFGGSPEDGHSVESTQQRLAALGHTLEAVTSDSCFFQCLTRLWDEDRPLTDIEQCLEDAALQETVEDEVRKVN